MLALCINFQQLGQTMGWRLQRGEPFGARSPKLNPADDLIRGNSNLPFSSHFIQALAKSDIYLWYIMLG